MNFDKTKSLSLNRYYILSPKSLQALETTPNSQGLLNALAIDDPIEYARLALNNEMTDWVWAMDNVNM